MSKRLIDADALIAEMHNVTLEDGEDRRTFYEVIERQPTVDAVEVKHGEWKFIGDSEEPYDCAWMCSVCGKMYWVEDSNMVTEDAHYCPNCGAKMDGERRE